MDFLLLFNMDRLAVRTRSFSSLLLTRSLAQCVVLTNISSCGQLKEFLLNKQTATVAVWQKKGNRPPELLRDYNTLMIISYLNIRMWRGNIVHEWWWRGLIGGDYDGYVCVVCCASGSRVCD